MRGSSRDVRCGSRMSLMVPPAPEPLDGDEVTKACGGCGKAVLADEPDLCIACELYGPPATRQHSVEEAYAEPGSVNWFGDSEPSD